MHTVFVLGAGASRRAGAPLMADFIDRASLRSSVENDSRLKAAFELVFRAIADLQAVHAKAFLDTDNIEALFGAVEMGDLISKFGTHKPEDIPAIREALVGVIVRTLEYSIPFPADEHSVKPPPPYGPFAALLRKHLGSGFTQHTFALITFNYDIALDYALHNGGIRFDYGLSGSTPSDGTLSYLKLHGSINWAVCGKCDEIAPLDLRKVRFDLHPKTTQVHFDVGSRIHQFVEHCGQPTTRPYLVPPTWNKAAHHQRLRNVWRAAATELGRAENLVVIGYSLPETDAFFRYLLALGSQSDTRLRRFWVIDPDRDGSVRRRFGEITGRGIANRVRFFDHTMPTGGLFEGSLGEIEAALDERD